MVKKPPPINFGFIPKVNQDNIDIEWQYNIDENASVVSAQNVRIIDENNTFPGEIEEAMPVDTTPIARPINERRGATTDTIVISGVITTIGAVLGTTIAVGIESFETAKDSGNFQSDEFKDSIQDRSTKYAAIGGATGGALGLLTSLVLSRYVADFGELSRAWLNNAETNVRERANEFGESIEQMREGWRNFTQFFSGENSQETQTNEQDANEHQGMELTRAQILQSPGAFASNQQAHRDTAATFEARNPEEAKQELKRRSEQNRTAPKTSSETSEIGVARMPTHNDISSTSYDSDSDIEKQVIKESLKSHQSSLSEDERKPAAKKTPPKRQESSYSQSSSEMDSNTEHSVNSDNSSILSGEYADDERSIRSSDESTKWQDKHKKPTPDQTKNR